ncbi:hypothetical protein J4226_02600 [Candidatus Pacearchaeota archaeon]|nr:hypothetical protein [Candidatus Pacearchaeota archaeon]
MQYEKFSTKANTLKILEKRLKKSIIEPSFFFSESAWRNNPESIVKHIKKKFGDRIVVRSSAISEDTAESSMAGFFDSVLNVDSQNVREIKEAIVKVIKSYHNKKSQSAFNQVLVQNQSGEIIMSGVVFTRGSENGAPYYIINYDDSSGSTESVTSGIENKSIKIIRNCKRIGNKIFDKLIESVREIENLFNSSLIDIEFGINKNFDVIIFQARPLVTKNIKFGDEVYFKKIEEIKKGFRKLNKKIKGLEGNHTILADMPDWNPAEIIGDSSGLLDYSLYNYIITERAWSIARQTQGYYDVGDGRLVYLFGNKPYVDVRRTFNSFVPKDISPGLRRKLVNYYLDSLASNPEYQDKVEFNILFTCYDFSLEKKFENLRAKNFNEQEIRELKNALMCLTNSLIINSKKNIENDISSSKDLSKTRNKIKIIYEKDIVFQVLDYAKILLNECKEHGTVQFSRLARLGFIGKILLKSLCDEGALSREEADSFFESINTVATEFSNDFNKLVKGKLDEESFLKKYGHLRPGTYDITSKRYDQNKSLLEVSHGIHMQEAKSKRFCLSKKSESSVNAALKKSGLKFDAKFLFNFIENATKARELSKFEFTKNLSDAIELIAIAGKEMGFTRKEMSFLSIEDIFANIKNRNGLTNYWKRNISMNKKRKAINDKLFLPSIIFTEKDLDVVKEYSPKPNYITNKKITKNVVNLKNVNERKFHIKNKIVLIESGDPGYDWIFTKGIAGLITKYGGVASHMSIRCAEFGLPAAIGCGVIYDKLIDGAKVTLDCESGRIWA